MTKTEPASCLYEGVLRHRRFAAPSRSFRYPLFMVYLDLGELDSLFTERWLWSATRPNVAWFRRADHYGDPLVSLEEVIRDLVRQRTGARPAGPIRLLTHLRYWGYGFSPVSFYYCHDATGTKVETVIAEVNNTPWGERHMYVLPESDDLGGPGRDDAKRFDFRKAFHVSPFLPMEMDYTWCFGIPGERLWVHMENRDARGRVFDATLSLERRAMRGAEMARVLAVYPLMTVRVICAIYAQALRLFLRRATFHPHPTRRPA